LDGLGSVVALSDSSGNIVEAYSYDVFGAVKVHTGAGANGIWLTSDDDFNTPEDKSDYGNPYRFTGRRYDEESGLYYYRARMYAPAIGRFMQTDPIGYADSMNREQHSHKQWRMNLLLHLFLLQLLLNQSQLVLPWVGE